MPFLIMSFSVSCEQKEEKGEERFFFFLPVVAGNAVPFISNYYVSESCLGVTVTLLLAQTGWDRFSTASSIG